MIFHQPHNSLSNYNYNIAFYTDTEWDYHFHKNSELIYVLQGALRCTVNNTVYRLTTGEFGLCLPYDIHRIQPEKNTHFWILVFSDDFVGSFSKQIAGKKGDGFSFRPAPAVHEYLLSQLIGNQSPTVFTLKSCLYAVCETYLESVKLVDRNKKETEAILSVVDYISENHTKRITLADVAEQTGYDYNYMSRYFRKVFNMTFSDFVNAYRLETAIHLLEHSSHSIIEVAMESGFQSVRTFNDFFKKHTGMSPTEYKNASRN